jgi:putative ABC transport system ATP-binding protein
MIIEAREITRTYPIGERQVSVIDRVSLAVEDGQFLVVQGSSGSGKTTLLSLLSGLDRPTSGRVLIQGRDITDLTEDELAPMRNETIGFVFQSFHLVPSLTAAENIMFPAELKGDNEACARAEALLDRIGLRERATNFPHQLSGGEKQRVAICRALVNDPRIIFADEPTGNLDSRSGRDILELLMELKKEQQATLVLVTHSMEITRLADRVITLHDGRITSDSRPSGA